ncbi:hypothetical protein I4U23_003208 [Adineta vaga]|nr:hypothetical protein I4U23_003208 [Adineta vaga]
MVEPEQRDKSGNLEDTVRNLREENAKLLQLLRSQGLLVDSVDEKSNESSNITFDNSEVTLTTNSINTTNQITHQHVNNHGPTNQQNYSGQVIHGNQSNITPNFNTVIQTTTQPFVQNNSNTLVQNNTNLIQPINLVNFNNVSLDSLQSFFASQNNLVYLSQSSSSTSSSTTTTTTTTSNFLNESEQHQISIRPKPSVIPQPQSDLTSVISKVNENTSRQLSSSSSSTNGETTNLLDNDLNHKQPRPIRPKPSSRTNSLQVYTPVVINETKPSTTNVLTPSSLINNTNASSTVSLLSPSASFEEHHMDLSPQLIHSKSVDLSVPPTNNLLTSTKKPNRNRKKPVAPPLPLQPPQQQQQQPSSQPSSSISVPSTNPTLIPIAPNLGRPLAPAPLNVQRVVATNKRSTANKKRNSKTLVQYHSESILQQTSPTSNSFAESISGLMQHFDQELLASNFLSQPPPTTNILSNDTPLPPPLPPPTVPSSSSSSSSSNINLIRTLDNIDVRQIVNTTIHRTESSYQSMPTFDEFNDRLDTETTTTITDYNVDNEQITSFMNEEDMRFVEMNFDENTFLKQFDLDDAGIKLNINSEQNIFGSLLTNNHHLNTTIEQTSSPLPLPQPPPPPIYPGSSLINNNVFTTVVPLGLQHQSSYSSSFNNRNSSVCLPEEGVQLTARHIEPSQVATYESVKYQDILDDLVTVTDQDVLSHVQAAAVAANDTTVITTDFSFALIEATNEIIKTADIEGAEETASAFVDLQYFYPTIEQEQELLQKQLEQCEHKVEPEPEPEPMLQPEPEHELADIPEDKFDSEINPTADSPKSEDNSAITDLASILQINQTHSSSPIKEISSEIDYDALLPPPTPSPPSPPPPPPPTLLPSQLQPMLSLSQLQSTIPPPSQLSPTLPTPQLQPPLPHPTLLRPPAPVQPPPIPPPSLSSSLSSTTTSTTNFSTLPEQISRKACIIFEPILSPTNPASPIKPAEDELVLDSGCLTGSSSIERPEPLDTNQIEELLNETSENQFDVIENQGQTMSLSSSPTHLTSDNLDDFIEQVEEPAEKLLEKNFLHYQQIYQESQKKTPKEQYSPIPSVKLKLNSIYPKPKKKRKTSPAPVLVCENVRPPLKIKIRTKLPLPPLPEPSPPKEEQPPSLSPLLLPPPAVKIKIRKPIKKPKRKKSSIDDQLDREAKLSLKTEYAGLTRFEQSLAQLYHTQSSPDTRVPPTPGENEDLPILPNKQDTPPTNELKQVNSAISSENQMKKLAHLFNYDDEPLNNNTFITPPPEIDTHIHHHTHAQQQLQKTSNDIEQSPKKMKKSKPNSFHNKEYYSASRKTEHLPQPPAPPPPIHMDPYAQPYHHFDARTAPFFNFPFPNPFMNPHPPAPPAPPPSNHFHHNAMKYHYPTHNYPPHQQQFSYHPHLQRQQQYNNTNYMSSHNHHPFSR